MSSTSRKPLKAQAREMLVSLHKYFVEERNRRGTLIPVTKVNERVAAALKINKNTVTRVLQEKYGKQGNQCNVLRTPRKKYIRNRFATEVDVFRSDAIRRHVYNFYLRGDFPTVKKMVPSLQEAGLFEGQGTSLRKFLKSIGFCYKTCDHRRLIMDRADIALMRCTFLRTLKDANWDSIVFTGETWIGDTIASVTGGENEAAKIPISKLDHLVVFHAGGVEGFVDGALLAYVTKRAYDKHEEVQATTYRKWFETQLLPNIPPGSTIMMNDTPYHSVEGDPTPGTMTKTADIHAWLARRGVACDENLRKPELMALVKNAKPSPPEYEIDRLALRHGHRVLRVPPHHSTYNPIELIWAQVKSYMAEGCEEAAAGTGALDLVRASLADVTAAAWRKFIAITKQKVNEDWDTYGVLESRVEELLANIEDYSECSESDSNEENM